jgi:hypothetical protein
MGMKTSHVSHGSGKEPILFSKTFVMCTMSFSEFKILHYLHNLIMSTPVLCNEIIFFNDSMLKATFLPPNAMLMKWNYFCV